MIELQKRSPLPSVSAVSTRRFNRRKLLVAGGGSAVAALLASNGVSIASAAAPSKGLVGYLAGSDTATWTGRPGSWLGSAPVTVLPANAIPGDAVLASGAIRVGVYGLFPAAPDPRLISSILFEVAYPSTTVRSGTPVVFAAWQFSNGKTTKVSPSVDFRAAVSDGSFPEFRITVKETNGAVRVLRSTLTLDLSNGGPRLRKGIYLLAMREGTWNQPVTINPAGSPNAAQLSLVIGVGLPDRGATTRGLGGRRRTGKAPVNALNYVNPKLGRAPLVIP